MKAKQKIKVCGVCDQVEAIDALGVDFIGHIFWERSARYYQPASPVTFTPKPKAKRIGVFVDAPFEVVMATIQAHNLDGVQLHGSEHPKYLERLRGQYNGLIFKAFSISAAFDFDQTKAYESLADLFVFDAAGRLPGGNGQSFSWDVLDQYSGSTHFLLSGGIGPEKLEALRTFMCHESAKQCIGLDLNSQFEHDPGNKDLLKLAKFITQIHTL